MRAAHLAAKVELEVGEDVDLLRLEAALGVEHAEARHESREGAPLAQPLRHVAVAVLVHKATQRHRVAPEAVVDAHGLAEQHHGVALDERAELGPGYATLHARHGW